MTTPPVRVESSIIVVGLYFSQAYEIASASTSRPSASVFVTSTVVPLYIVMMSSGR